MHGQKRHVTDNPPTPGPSSFLYHVPHNSAAVIVCAAAAASAVAVIVAVVVVVVVVVFVVVFVGSGGINICYIWRIVFAITSFGRV